MRELVLAAFAEKGLLPSKEVVLAAFAEKGLLPSMEVAHWRVLYVVRLITVYEAVIRMEPHVDSFRRIFSGRVLSEGKTLRTATVAGFALVASQVGQFIKFDETPSSHGGHTSAGSVPAQELPRLHQKVRSSMLFC